MTCTTEVRQYLSQPRFHKTFILSPNPETGRLKPHRFSYSDFGDHSSNAVVLFCGGLMATRLCYSPLDQLANTHNVRIIHADRPGIGRSSTINLEKRVQLWLEMVPQLLKRLNIPYVSLASHSGGSIYLLNTLLAYPHLLHPHQPYVCLFAPWVSVTDCIHSGLQVLTSQLPASVIGQWAPIAKVYNTNIAPLLGLSSSHVGSRDPLYPLPILPTLSPTSSNWKVPAGGLSFPGMYKNKLVLALDNDVVIEELRQRITNVTFSESMDGMSADAQLFLGKVPWCSPSIVWSDIDHFVPLLSKILEEEDRMHNHATLRIDAFHAEHDNMVGQKGGQWFDDCWKKHPSYHYSSEVVRGTDHDYILDVDPAIGASEKWLRRVRDAVPRPVANVEGTSLLTNEALSRRTHSLQRTIGWIKRLSWRIHRH
ncbi:hypothetical protein DE146DRAFT_611778 [Phaeosphaeria sp. MPI-PUGE-AT-0046c]|nr:hypothetical protein DE146DRAFT_611778 [Phaeosphaeria sp. MPI-PUGE-AT-0046c]